MRISQPWAWGSALVAGAGFLPRLLGSFLPSPRPAKRGRWWRGGRGPERGGGWRRRLGSVSLPKPSPRKPGLHRSLKKERLAGKPEAGGRGIWRGEGGQLALQGPVRGGGWGPVPWAPRGQRVLRAWDAGSSYPPAHQHTHTHIHSFLQQIHIYQVLSVPGTVSSQGGGRGRKMNEAVTEASESTGTLDQNLTPAFPWLSG